jgi:hypothetical protein
MIRASRAWIFTAICLAGFRAPAQQHDEKERAALANALKSVKLTLEKGLLASEAEGRPISAKFDVEKGAVTLSVYAMKGERFAQIAVDPQTGKVARVTEIRGGSELAEARAQSEAQAKVSLRTATQRAVQANPGSRAISVTPTASGGRPVAEVMLLLGNRFKAVTQRLD